MKFKGRPAAIDVQIPRPYNLHCKTLTNEENKTYGMYLRKLIAYKARTVCTIVMNLDFHCVIVVVRRLMFQITI